MQKSGDFPSMDMQQAMRLAKSDTARQLYSILSAAGGDQLRTAMDQAAAGDMNAAKAMLQNLMTDPTAQALLAKLQEDANG